MADAVNKDTGKLLTFTVNEDLSSFTVCFQDQERRRSGGTQVLPTITVAEPLASAVASTEAGVATADLSSEYSEEKTNNKEKKMNEWIGMEQELDFLTNGLDTSVNILDTTDSSSDYDEVGCFSQEQFFTPIKKTARRSPPTNAHC
ncbi:hypothetical protein SEMRO_1858_G302070.1 [Seminavis robusta]|uniref:Uncharacterized protein n=1 Tax=Seminavis robusta TaxID=568900 RepID=A0A9N8EXM7_9STRA|nr:hypothetical protein SEMRO_1858_G302070.1 [Seminavis robusta]|eukprot:Sro1858_g302070.1 n/a (146) ;mRNA; r:4479-4916